jgi:spore germination protein GerM
MRLRFAHITAIAAMMALTGISCHRKSNVAEAVKLANKVSRREVRLYYESPDLLLVPEVRSLELPQDEAAAIGIVVSELLKGSANASVPRLFPADTALRAAYLLPGGNAIVDLGGPTIVTGWNTGSHAELMAIYSLVQTLTSDFTSVRRVRLLVNGQPAVTLAGHIDLTRPLVADPTLVAKH